MFGNKKKQKMLVVLKDRYLILNHRIQSRKWNLQYNADVI